MPLNLNAAGIDQNKTAQQACGIVQGHGRRDPATHRRANDQDITQIEPFEEFKIGKGEIINTIEPLGAWLARKSRMGRHQDMCRAGEHRSQANHRLWSSTTMQQENGTTAPLLIDVYGQAVGEGLS